MTKPKAKVPKRKKHSKLPQKPAMTPDALKRIREALELTQDRFAEELGVQPLTIGLWEGGKTAINKSRAIAIIGLAARLSGRLPDMKGTNWTNLK